MGVDRDQNRHARRIGLRIIIILACVVVGLGLSPAAAAQPLGRVHAGLLGTVAGQTGQPKPSAPAAKTSGQSQQAAQQQPKETEEPSDDDTTLDPIARQGIPKPEIEPFSLLRNAQSLLPSRPSLEELRLARVLLVRGPTNDQERETLHRIVLYQVLRLSDPREFSRQRRNLTELQRTITTARRNPAVYAVVRDAVLQAATRMFSHHIVSRVAAGIVLNMLADEASLPLLVEQIKNPKQHESVKIWCIKAIREVALRDPQLRIRDKRYEQQSLAALLELLRSNPPPHLWTQREIIRALGAIGRPTEDLLSGDANVARELVLLLRGTNLRSAQGEVPEGPGRVVRVAATESLVLLVIPPNLDYNFQIVGAEIARFAVEAAYAALRDPLIDRLQSYLYVRRCYQTLTVLAGDPTGSEPAQRNGIAAQHPLANQQSDPQYLRQLRDLVGQLNREMLRVYRPSAEEVDPKDIPRELLEKATWVRDRLKESRVESLANDLLSYLNEHPPRGEGRLTPATEPLPPPPQLRSPSAQTAAKGNGIKGSTDGVANP